MKTGQMLVELILAMGMLAILLPALSTGLITSSSGKVQNETRQEASLLLQEELESLDVVRNAGWTTFATDGVFHTTVSSDTWVLTPGVETISIFSRQVEIIPVYRDNGAIVTSGGILDPSTKMVVATVSWDLPYPNSISTTRYFTRYHDNFSIIEDTQAQFDLGTKSSVKTTNTSGGEVTLSTGFTGRGDWCQPNINLVALNLPGQAITTAVSAIVGHAYTTTGGNASGNSMDTISITNPAFPTDPVASNSGSYNLYKTYGIFATPTYIYLTSDHPGTVVDIVNASNLTNAGFFTTGSGGTPKGTSVTVSGNTGFVTAGSNLYSFDVTTIKGSTSQTQLGSVGLSGVGQRIMIIGIYAYISTNSPTNQVQIINISNPANMTVVSSLDLGNSLSGVDLYASGSGNLVYVATAYTAGKSDVFTIDASNKSSPQIKASYSTNGMNPEGIVAVSYNKVIVVGSGGEQYQVLRAEIQTALTHCGGLTNPNGSTSVNAIATVSEPDGDSYSYILTNTATQEFQMINGGPSAGDLPAQTGTFTSAPFYVDHSTAFNRLTWTADVPVGTTLEFQVAVADLGPTDCSDATYTFVGPDGTPSTYFTVPAAIPLNDDGGYYQNPGQCFKYQAILSTTDTSPIPNVPVLDNVTWGFSP